MYQHLIDHSCVNYAIYFLRDFLDKDMSRTKVIISYLSPLLALEDPELELFITRLVVSGSLVPRPISACNIEKLGMGLGTRLGQRLVDSCCLKPWHSLISR